MQKSLYILIALVAAFTSAVPSSESDDMLTSALKIIKDCGDKSIVLCLKERALHYMDKQTGDVKLSDGIQLIKTDDIPVGRSLNDIDLPTEPDARESEIDSLLVERFARFFGTHTLQFKVPKDSIEEMQRSLEEARGKKKKQKYLLPLLLLFKLKAAALLPLVIGFLALIAFKALIVGKIALLLSGIIGLKKLLDSKNSSHDYEVVAHPHHASYDEHGHYARSLKLNNNNNYQYIQNNNNNNNNDNVMDAQNLAYSAHINK